MEVNRRWYMNHRTASLRSGKRCWREIAEIETASKLSREEKTVDLRRCGDFGNDCINWKMWRFPLADMTRCGRCLPRIEKVEAKVACGVSSKKCNAVLHERQVVSGLRQAEASMRCKCSRSNLIET